MKKLLLKILLGLILIADTFAVDIIFRANPSYMMPQDTSLELSSGFGLTLQADADLFGFLTIGAEGIFDMADQKKIDEKLFFYGGGLGLGLYYFPLSRLYLSTGASFGIYQATTTASQEEKSASDLYRRFYAETGFRFTPEFTLSANASYINFYTSADSETALSLGLSARYTIPLGKGGSSAFILFLDQDSPAFPMFMKAYRKYPLATLYLRNNEGAEVKNIHVSFRAGKYTSSTFESQFIPRISKHKTEVIELHADFSKEILRFVENGKISGEILVDYEFLGKKKHTVQNVTLSVYNSNAYMWVDPASLSSFISPDTPEILEFAKYTAGIARNDFVNGLNRNLQIAAAMTEALRASGLTYSQDKLTPYTSWHLTNEIDDIQYPMQTLNMSTGDYDDMGLLLASCLESVGVPTGYLLADDDFIVLVCCQISPSAAKNHFESEQSLVTNSSNVYFGISMASFSKGFTEARKTAARKIKKIKEEAGEEFEFTEVHTAWDIYEPCAYSDNGSHYEKPAAARITKACKQVIQEYISTDLEKVLARAKQSSNHNTIGLALLRMGRYAEAKAEFTKDGGIKAMNNLAMIYTYEKNYSSAKKTYEKVLEKDPTNAIALKGVEKTKYMLEK